MVHLLQNTWNFVISRCCFADDGKEMNQDSKRTCTAIVLLIKHFVWCRSRHRRRRGLLKLPIVRWEIGDAFYVIVFENIRIHPSTRYRIRCGYIFFHSGERIYFLADSLSNLEDTSGRAHSIWIRYVWTGKFLNPERKSCGFKNIRIRVDGALNCVLHFEKCHAYKLLK